MTNSELLRMAAYAARIKLSWDVSGRVCWLESSRKAWNPLTDDGDALRLAVNLGIEIGNYHQYGRALATIGCTRGVGEFWEINPDDHCAATRRAIVRAAAEIGKTRSD
jgi:hypothetical protein